jgi:acetyl esterase/lipase
MRSLNPHENTRRTNEFATVCKRTGLCSGVMASTPFDPDLRRIAAMLPRGGNGRRILPLMRRLEPLMERRSPPEGVVSQSDGSVSVRLHLPPKPASAPYPAVLWIHGGGFVMGSPAQDDAVCQVFAQKLGALVAAVRYRRAPEHQFPAALQDCHDGLEWLANRDDVDPGRIAIGGASAGGGLAAALALLARERAVVTPRLQLLSYPMLDDRTVLRTDLDERYFRLWSNEANRFGWTSYLGREPGTPGVSPLAAPAREENLSGLPPAWIGVGTLDLFFDEDLAYAKRLRTAGVPCEVHVVEGAFHGFDSVAPKARLTRTFRIEQVQALASAFGIAG